MTVGERIRDLREKRGISQVAFADAIDVTKQTLYKYEKGIVTNIPSDKIEATAKYFGVSPAYLMGWEESDIASYPNARPITTRRLPVLSAVACGEPIMMQEEKEFYVDVTTDIHADFILIAKGDSMIGARIHDGDLVFIHSQPEVENGEIAAVAIDDDATLKRFYKYRELIVLRSENPAYKEMEFRPEDGHVIRVLGKAVAFQSDVK